MFALQDWVNSFFIWYNFLLTYAIALTVYDLFLSLSLELRGIWRRKFGTGTILYLSTRYGAIFYILFMMLWSVLVPSALIVSISIQFRLSWLSLKLRGEHQNIPEGVFINLVAAVKYFGTSPCCLRFTLNFHIQVYSHYSYLMIFWKMLAFDCIRIWAICGHSWLPTCIVFALSMFPPAINIVCGTVCALSWHSLWLQYANIPALTAKYSLVPSGPLAGCWITENFDPFA